MLVVLFAAVVPRSFVVVVVGIGKSSANGNRIGMRLVHIRPIYCNKFSKKGCGAPSPRGGLAAAVLVATWRSWQAKADATEEGCNA